MSAKPCNRNAEESFPVLSLKSREQKPPNPLLIQDKDVLQPRSEPRRIITKVEVSEQGENRRFIVTNLHHGRNAYIDETIYGGRGQMENDIKDHKRFLHSDRLSCRKFEANPFRLFLHSAAYVLMHTLRTKGLRGTAWSRAQFDQIQLRILKVGARVEAWKTKIRFPFPSSVPLQEIYARVMANLSSVDLRRSP